MQTRLAVAVLQCRFSRDIRASYNRFLRHNRSVLRTANGRLKAHFMAQGASRGQREYDRYTTALANAYGGAQISVASCARTSSLVTEAALPRTSFHSLAAREVIAPTLPSPPCRPHKALVIAAGQTSAASSSVVAE
jgi:hypothetical protein